MASGLQIASVQSVADYLLMKIDPGAGDLISNMKLQKLLYYCQGWHMAAFGRPLFSERIEAWEHGPVVPDIYHRFKHFGSQAIPPELADRARAGSISFEARRVVDDVWDRYGEMHAARLRNKTHKERPWRDAFHSNRPDAPITLEALRDFFEEEGSRMMASAASGPLPEGSMDWARSLEDA